MSDFDGAIVLKEFLSSQEEAELVENLSKEKWVPSQSGRFKLDFGLTKVNFKKKKVKTS